MSPKDLKGYQNAHSCISCNRPVSLAKAHTVPISGNLFLLFCQSCSEKLSSALEPMKPAREAELLNKAEQIEQATTELKKLISGEPSPDVAERIEEAYNRRPLRK